MSIETSMANYKAACNEIKTNIDSAYNSCEEKGAMMPSNQIIENLPNCIKSIVIPTFKTQAKSYTPTKLGDTIVPDSGYDGLLQVTVDPIPDNYINSDNLIMHCSQSATGTFTGSNQTCEKLSIGGLTFRPKIALIIATSPVTTTNTSSPYDICAVWRIMNDNYSKLTDNCTFVYKSGSSVKSGHTASNGLRGNADGTITGWGTSARFASGTTYSWYAWG